MGFWETLGQSDDFKCDWYGELTNQMAKTFFGLLMVMIFVAGYREISGEMPLRWVALLVCFLPYVAIEWLVQGWKSGDAWFDSLMYAFGMAVPLVAFEEIAVTATKTALALDHRAAMIGAALWAIALGFRVAKRYRNTGNPEYNIPNDNVESAQTRADDDTMVLDNLRTRPGNGADRFDGCGGNNMGQVDRDNKTQKDA